MATNPPCAAPKCMTCDQPGGDGCLGISASPVVDGRVKPGRDEMGTIVPQLPYFNADAALSGPSVAARACGDGPDEPGHDGNKVWSVPTCLRFAVAWSILISERSASNRLAPFRLALDKLALWRFAPDRLALDKLA
jgi:hypothetical protein